MTFIYLCSSVWWAKISLDEIRDILTTVAPSSHRSATFRYRRTDFHVSSVHWLGIDCSTCESTIIIVKHSLCTRHQNGFPYMHGKVLFFVVSLVSVDSRYAVYLQCWRVLLLLSFGIPYPCLANTRSTLQCFIIHRFFSHFSCPGFSGWQGSCHKSVHGLQFSIVETNWLPPFFCCVEIFTWYLYKLVILLMRLLQKDLQRTEPVLSHRSSPGDSLAWLCKNRRAESSRARSSWWKPEDGQHYTELTTPD